MLSLRTLSSIVAVVAIAGLSSACTTAAPDDTSEASGSSSSSGQPVDIEPMDEPAAPFALMELFTSEG